MNSRNRCKAYVLLRFQISLMAMLLLALQQQIQADEGQPVAIRYWPESGISIETMWNFHVAIGVDSRNRAMMPRAADVEFIDDFWAASASDTLVLDRRPNETKALFQPARNDMEPSSNAVKFSRVVVASATSDKSISLNVIDIDGVTIVDSNKHQVSELNAVLQATKELPQGIRSIDALLVDDAAAEVAAYQTLQALLKPRVIVLRNSAKLESSGDVPITRVPHNTFAISKATVTGKTTWVKLSEVAWEMDPTLAELFRKKEAACKASREVFAPLSVKQMNFRPSNGTHTPRWNAEHMMGRELLFFSQIYHAVDSSIPIIDFNPKQMPPDYRAAHADWTGLEESLQMERVEGFTRRFAYMLEGMDLDKTATGSTFWTPRALLRQMNVHYTEHTANVVKKKDLPEWPTE